MGDHAVSSRTRGVGRSHRARGHTSPRAQTNKPLQIPLLPTVTARERRRRRRRRPRRTTNDERRSPSGDVVRSRILINHTTVYPHHTVMTTHGAPRRANRRAGTPRLRRAAGTQERRSIDGLVYIWVMYEVHVCLSVSYDLVGFTTRNLIPLCARERDAPSRVYMTRRGKSTDGVGRRRRHIAF